MEIIKIYRFVKRNQWNIGKPGYELQYLEIHQKGDTIILIDEMENAQQLEKFHYLLSGKGEATLYATVSEQECRVFAGCELVSVAFV